MKLFLKYFALGLLCLPLHLAFPSLRVEWIVLVLAYGAFHLNLSHFVLLLLSLAPFYSQYSLVKLWQWPIPYLLAVLLYYLLKRSFFIRSFWQLTLLIVTLFMSDFLFWELKWISQGTWDQWYWLSALLGLALTMFAGLMLVPLMSYFLQRFYHALPKPHRALAELNLFRYRQRKRPQVKNRFGF